MKNEKIKIEIDLLRDSLRNIFVVMFAIMSGEVSLIYKILHNNFNYADFILILLGFVSIICFNKYKK
ncbi:hypothetical protein JCM11957_12360 [Caminibacter profundus]